VRHIQGIVTQVTVLLNPPEAAITIVSNDATPIVAIVASDLNRQKQPQTDRDTS
jgi:hypothetical protein